MVKGKTRLQTHHAQPGPPRRKVQTVSNTSTRVCRVFTTIATMSNSHAHDSADNNEYQQSVIDDVPFDDVPATDTFTTDAFASVNPADIANPTGIHVHVKAKRYQNSVCISSTMTTNQSDISLRMHCSLLGSNTDRNI